MGAFEEAKGKVKEAVGDLTDNEGLEREGEAQKEKGEAQRQADQARQRPAQAKAQGSRAGAGREGEVALPSTDMDRSARRLAGRSFRVHAVIGSSSRVLGRCNWRTRADASDQVVVGDNDAVSRGRVAGGSGIAGGLGRGGSAGRCSRAAACSCSASCSSRSCGSPSTCPEDPPELQSAVLVAEDGQELAVLSQEGQRFIVPLDEVNPVVVDALLSAEDRRFYEHGGIDPIGIGRAARQQPAHVRHPGRDHAHPAAGEERVPHHRAVVHAQGP